VLYCVPHSKHSSNCAVAFGSGAVVVPVLKMMRDLEKCYGWICTWPNVVDLLSDVCLRLTMY